MTTPVIKTDVSVGAPTLGDPSLGIATETDAFASCDAPANLLVPFWLSSFIKRLPLSRHELVHARQTELVRQARLFSASNSMPCDARDSLSHLAIVGADAMQLCAAALASDGRGLGDDRAVSAAFEALSQTVFADGVVDYAERAILHGAVRVVDFEPPMANVTALLWTLAAGRRLPANEEPFNIASDLSGNPMPPLYRNRGVTRIVRPGFPPAGYRWLAPSDPLVRNRNARAECFTFALSHDTSWSLAEGASPHDIVQERYRPVELAHEKARPGDLIAYYPLIWSLDRAKQEVIAGELGHLAVVTTVDSRGRPLRAASKMGWRMGVFEHPVAEVPLGLGIVWTVMREKK